eukprot:9090900-Lingulodinium_polyedra.AAC.1
MDRNPLFVLSEKNPDSKPSQVCQIRVDACGSEDTSSTRALSILEAVAEAYSKKQVSKDQLKAKRDELLGKASSASS